MYNNIAPKITGKWVVSTLIYEKRRAWFWKDMTNHHLCTQLVVPSSLCNCQIFTRQCFKQALFRLLELWCAIWVFRSTHRKCDFCNWIFAHKIVLAAASECFKTMIEFESSLFSESNSTIETTRSYDGILTLMRYIYKGRLDLATSSPFDMMEIAEEYEMASLLVSCELCCKQRLSLDNVLQYLQLNILMLHLQSTLQIQPSWNARSSWRLVLTFKNRNASSFGSSVTNLSFQCVARQCEGK